MKSRNGLAERLRDREVVALPGVELRLTAEHALRAAIDSQVFAALRTLEALDGGRAVQAVYVALIRRLPRVLPDRRRLAIDSGVSESSVKRAIKLLEQTRLVQVERIKGQSSVYHLADLRSVDVASECLSRIRWLSQSAGNSLAAAGRATCEPTISGGRVASGPGGRVRSDREVGPHVVHKETMKIPNQQQAVAGVGKGEGLSIDAVLKRWGLESASYLVKPGHGTAIPVLTTNPERAAMLIDRTMRQGRWSDTSGVGAKVSFLRENLGRIVASVDAEGQQKANAHEEARRRAKRIAERLIRENPAERQAADSEHEETLFQRGLERLGEKPEVLRFLSKHVAARRCIIARELEREALICEVETMTDAEFMACCERLFAAHPGFRRLYGTAKRESTGLKVSLLEFLWNERRQAIEAAIRCSTVASPVSELDSSEPDAALVSQ